MTEIEELCKRLAYFESIGIMGLKRGEELEFSCPECGADTCCKNSSNRAFGCLVRCVWGFVSPTSKL